jgi:hypothetical protein
MAAVQIQRFDSAGADDEELRSQLPGGDEHFTVFDAPHSAMRCDALDLLRR